MPDEEEKSTRGPPVRPFLTGAAIAAGWGALNVPSDGTIGGLAAFAAQIVAIMLVAAGAVAMGIEAIGFTVRVGRTWLKR